MNIFWVLVITYMANGSPELQGRYYDNNGQVHLFTSEQECNTFAAKISTKMNSKVVRKTQCVKQGEDRKMLHLDEKK
jgi:hypothetical protein